jgi:hypothetical protein
MKWLFVLALISACAHDDKTLRPNWVDGVRSGEEALKVTQGDKIFYRRLASVSDQSQVASCDLAVTKAHEDLQKEFPDIPRIPFTVEVMFYDPEYKDCAVTISLPKSFHQSEELKARQITALARKSALENQSEINENDVAEILKLRAEIAQRFALEGLTRSEFEKFAQDSVSLVEGSPKCSEIFQTPSYSIHGSTQICWRNDVIAGYCTQTDGKCWIKRP